MINSTLPNPNQGKTSYVPEKRVTFRLSFSALLHRFHSHISSVLVLWSVVLAIVPATIVLSFALRQAEQQAHRQVVAQLESIASIKDSEIERWLNDQGTIIDLLMADSDKEQASIKLLQGEEQPLVVRDLLTEHLKGQQSFTEIFIYSLDGQILASSAALQEGKIVRNQPYFKASLTGDYVQPPFYEISTSNLNIIISRPIYTFENAIIGVMAGRLQLGELSQIMTERAGLGNSGETYLVSVESNYLVTASRFDGYPLARAYHSQGIDEALAGVSGAGIYRDYRGILAIGVYRWIPELQSALIAEIDESEALTSLHEVYNTLLIAALIIMSVAVSIGLALAVRITRPIVLLTRRANQIAAGNYALHGLLNRQDEIGQLGSAFNIMTKTLTGTIDELNLRIEQIKHVNYDLTIATVQAEEALHAKDSFLAVMSHELRTPLNAILGFAELIEIGGQVEGRTLHKIQRIRDNGARLLVLVNNVLDLTRSASGKLHLSYAPLDLREFIKDLSGQMDILAEKKGLEFKIEIDDSIPSEIVASQEALTKIITNLLSNAFKFTEQGEVHLKVYRRDDQLELEVSDTGIGIPPDMLDAVFEPFRQADDSAVKRTYEGTGLGLAIVKQLCLALGGLITLKSVVGQGSTFSIILPFETFSTAKVNIL